MIHYSCDRCKRQINPESEIRYVVHIDSRPVVQADPSGAADDDDDALLELHEIIERLEEEEAEGIVDCGRKRFDLCPTCYRRYIRDPLGSEASLPLGFSHN